MNKPKYHAVIDDSNHTVSVSTFGGLPELNDFLEAHGANLHSEDELAELGWLEDNEGRSILVIKGHIKAPQRKVSISR